MFRLLVDDVDDDDVVGLGVGPPWPGVASLLSPIKLDSLRLVGGPISGGDLGSGRITGGPISSGDLGSGRIVDT